MNQSISGNTDAIADVNNTLATHIANDMDLNSSNELIENVDFNGTDFVITEAGIDHGVNLEDLNTSQGRENAANIAINTEELDYIDVTANTTSVGNGANASGTNAIAIGKNTQASGTNSIATGTEAVASGENSIATGTGANASGVNAQASGVDAQASGTNSIATGTDAVASGENSIATGTGANASGVNAQASGVNAQASGINSIATGTNSVASAENSVAIGSGAKATHENSVALGAGSETTAANTVSVGKVGEERRITNVAAGIDNTDAANVGQLNVVDDKVEINIGNIATNRNGIKKNRVKNEEQDVVLANHEGRISTNTRDIHTNSLHIDTNTRGIAVNKNNIAVNSGRITHNTRRIEVVEDKVRYVNVTQSSMALGKGAKARDTRSIAIGKHATTSKGTPGSIAFGAYASVTQDAINSVALGQYSVANEANTISVGNDKIKRRITNVADGVNDYDAVNMRQYHFLDNKVNTLDRKVNGVAAMGSAMSALVPNGRSDKNTQVSLGLGTYKGETALAIGAFHYVDDDILLNAAVSHAQESGTSARAGITWGF